MESIQNMTQSACPLLGVGQVAQAAAWGCTDGSDCGANLGAQKPFWAFSPHIYLATSYLCVLSS